MKLEPMNCPTCGKPARGTVEWVPACSYFTEPGENGEVEYNGDTEPFWDGQATELTRDGRVLLECPDGHQWGAVMDGKKFTKSKHVIYI